MRTGRGARLYDRELKLQVIVHAEMNAVLNSARMGGAGLQGCMMYIACIDRQSGSLFSGPPCSQCSAAVIQAGITEVVGLPARESWSRWEASCRIGAALFEEAGVTLRILE